MKSKRSIEDSDSPKHILISLWKETRMHEEKRLQMRNPESHLHPTADTQQDR
jgi:hypothetical protein